MSKRPLFLITLASSIIMLFLMGLTIMLFIVNSNNEFSHMATALALFALLIFVVAVILVIYLTKSLEEKYIAETRLKAIIDSVPLAAHIYNKHHIMVECNATAYKFFGLQNKKEYKSKFSSLSPLYQPDGLLSVNKLHTAITEAFDSESVKLDWIHQHSNGEQIPCEINLFRLDWKEDEHVI